MLYASLLLMSFVLLKIAQEDWKGRAVHFYWFIMLFALLAWSTIDKMGFKPFLEQYVGNIIFIAVQLLLVNLYFCIVQRRWLWIFDDFLGWGDVVFLLAIAGAWDFGGFFLFFIGSLILILLFVVVYLKKRSSTIPLAGLQAVLFLVCYFLDRFSLLSIEGVLPY